LSQEVVEIRRKDGFFEILTGTDEIFTSKAILVTVGNGVFSPRRIGFDNEHSFSNILYSVDDINVFKDKVVTILGGGDSALDWAMMLEEVASKVNLVHRRNEYRAKEDSVLKLDQSSVNQYKNYVVNELIGQDELEVLEILEKDSKDIIELQQDYVLVNYGNITKVSDFGGLNLEKAKTGYETSRIFETSMSGIFACGNAVYYEGKPKLITVGLGEVPIVINAIKGHIDPSSKNKVFYSSTSK
ncbi:MAG: NAD(P)/FAD-dependent oxidoreductase, partial [Bacilli bacterium]